MAISELEAIIELAPQIAHCTAQVGSRSLLRPAPFEADNKRRGHEMQSNSRRLFPPNG